MPDSGCCYIGRYSYQKDVRVVPGVMPLPIGGGRNTTDTYRQAMLDLTHVVSPTVLATAQFAFTRGMAYQFGLSKGFDFKQLGFPENMNTVSVDEFTQAGISDLTGISNGQDAFVQLQPRNVWTMRGSISMSKGAHQIKAGVDYRILNFNENQNTAPNGYFSFGRTFTQGPNPSQSSSTGGFGFADFMLGMPNSGYIRRLNGISTQGLYRALFIQDDWRITDRLTVNIGLRWDLTMGNREKYNRLAWFDKDATNPLGAQAGLPNLKGVLRWIGGENSRDQMSTRWKDFGPRFGFAYKLTEKSVIRGGYGIFYLPQTVQGNGDGAIEAFRDTSMVATIDGGLTNANRLSNPFPQGILPPLNDRNQLANVGDSIAAPLFEAKSGYVQLSSLNFQWEAPGAIVIQAGYWGNKGTHLSSGSWNLNQLPDQYLALGNQLNNQVANPFYGLITSGSVSGKTISLRQSLLPFPQYSGVSQVFVPAGNSTYHAGTLSAEKRFTKSIMFLSSLTWSKGIDDVGGMIDIYNRRLNKVLSSFDTPFQWLGSWVYQLPFGKKHAIGSSWGTFTNAILGGWDIDGIVRVQSGQPVSIGGNNIGRSAKIENPTIARWFDTTAFVSTPSFTIQTTGPRSPDVRNDYTRNIDTVLVKTFQPSILERTVDVQFRAECFNLFNTPQFASPNGTVTSQNFGKVTSQRNVPREFQFGLKIKF